MFHHSTCSATSARLVVVVEKAPHGETDIYKLQYHSPKPVAQHSHVAVLTVGA